MNNEFTKKEYHDIDWFIENEIDFLEEYTRWDGVKYYHLVHRRKKRLNKGYSKYNEDE